MAQYLVVANQTLGEDALLQLMRKRAAAEPSEFVLVVPATPTLEQVRAVADAGAVMPQKSTYFFPKLWSGFLLNPLEP